MTRASLYTQNMGLANAIAREFYLPGADRDDVHQEARLALWIATGNYRPKEGGISFRTFARMAIKRDLADAVEAANRLKRRVLTDAERDPAQLELFPTPELEETVLARERLREAVRPE